LNWSKCKDALQFAQAVLTTAAIVAAAVWFLLQDQARLRLKIEHRVSSRALVNQRGIALGERLVAVDVFVSNSGDVPIDLKSGHMAVLDVNPGPPAVVWAPPEGGCPANMPPPKAGGCLAEMRLEPGEGDQIHEEIRVPARFATLQGRSFFPNLKSPKREFGWSYISVYDLAPEAQNPLPASTHAPTQEK
jgi:hypothetical protein